VHHYAIEGLYCTRVIEGRVGELNVMGSLSVRAEEALLVFVRMQGGGSIG
jgi:hypothetical protein